MSLFQIMLNFGVLFIMTLGYFFNLTIINIVCVIIPVIYIAIFLFLPESPSVLLAKNREDEAIKVMKSFRRNSYDYTSEINGLKSQNQQNEKSFIEVLQVKSTRKAFILILIVFFFFQMSAINVVLFYSTTIFDASSVDLDAGISSIIIGAIAFLSSCLASYFIEKLGRRILICLAFSLVFLSLCGIGIFFVLQENDINVDYIQWLPLTSLCIFVFSFNFGISPVSYALFGEIFVDEAKKFLAPITQAFNLSLTFVISMTFPYLVNLLGLGFTFIFFAIFTFIGLIYVIIYIPETKNKTREEIFKMLG